MSEADPNTLRNRAVGLLARREHSRFELARKLEQKGFLPQDIQPVLNELENENLLSDARYAEAFIHSRIEREHGPLKIRAELTQNGIDDSLIEQAFSTFDVNWSALAAKARSKRFDADVPLEYSEKARQARFLSARGFASETIWHLLGGRD